jgi:hypothetical protein
MKRKIAIILLLSLAGCVTLTFDPVEYDRYITLKMVADAAVPECGTDKINTSIDELSALIFHQYVSTSNRSGREQITAATTEMASLIASLQLRYKQGTPSIGYCQEKLKNISTGATSIVQTLGKM